MYIQIYLLFGIYIQLARLYIYIYLYIYKYIYKYIYIFNPLYKERERESAARDLLGAHEAKNKL